MRDRIEDCLAGVFAVLAMAWWTDDKLPGLGPLAGPLALVAWCVALAVVVVFNWRDPV